MNVPLKAKVYIYCLATIALIFSLFSLKGHSFSPQELPLVLFFVLINTAAESLPVPMPKGATVTVGFATIFAAIILFDTPAVILIAVGGYLFALGKKFNFYQYLFNSAQLCLSAGLAAYVYRQLVANNDIIFDAKASMVFPLLLSSLTYIFLNTLFVALVLGFITNNKPYAYWLSNMKWSAGNFLAMAPLGLLIALIQTNVGSWGVVLFLIPLLLARHSFKSYMDMRQSFLDTIMSLTTAIDAKDSYTRGHSSRVAEYAVATAKVLGYNESQLDKIRYISLLHDAGKIGISEEILNKPSSLSNEEFQEMKRHPVIGGEIVKNVKMLEGGEKIIRHHHERYDGKGYPDGIAGEEIPREARIIGVADSFDAMTSTRPYRKAMTPEEAFAELERCAGSQFDPEIVKAFIKAFPKVKIKSKEEQRAMAEAAATRETE
ncbi:MAG TPA: HD-GYP domain-containing protein [Firmicutes bacterium]|nr:HD-GYP domain-containing protein [Bacillota bacterium]